MDEQTATKETAQETLSNCDLIMKGGITSGVVYPLAIVGLSKDYVFKNIGGASAGAIAAATAAAAEYGRQHGGFTKLKALGDEIGDVLLKLFQPAKPFRPIFQAFLAVLDAKSGFGKTLGVLWALVWGYRGSTFLGALPGLALCGRALWRQLPFDSWILALLVVGLGVLAAVALRLYRAVMKQLPGHNYGICSGLNEENDGTALTEWLAYKLDHIAGRDPTAADAKPLTFGDLAGEDPDKPDINLVIMTTNLTSQRPHRIPFEQNIYLYRVSEFEKLFPPRIVKWMKEHSNPFVEGEGDLRWLPYKEQLPVIVAVRMSLSFPILLTAVPLHAKDFTYLDDTQKNEPSPCWFSDGGLSSNFPIHFFDALWPRWPTFGITLDKFDSERHDRAVWLPEKAGLGILTEFSDISSLPQFLGSIVAAMKGWRDSLQTVLPGYRERVVHVRLQEDEGGLMLNMPPELIGKLSGYGEQAGELLNNQFDLDAHRWRRYLVAMAKLEDLLEQGGDAFADDPTRGEDYESFLLRYAHNPAEYGQMPGWLVAADQNTQAFLTCAQKWLGDRTLRGGAIPQPESEIRIAPRV